MLSFSTFQVNAISIYVTPPHSIFSPKNNEINWISRDSYTGTAEEFFIDMMIQRHARLLLSTARLYALGKMAAALDVHLVAWLAGERERAARIDCAVLCVKKLHEDFAWPYPVVNDAEHYLQRKGSTVTSEWFCFVWHCMWLFLDSSNVSNLGFAESEFFPFWIHSF